MTTPTRQKLVDAAVKRFYRDGFRNVGIDQILTDVGISKTAFYKHFESKDDLMLAALDKQNVWLQNTFVEMINERGGQSPRGRLWAVLDVVQMIIESEDFQGCIFVNATMEFPLLHEPAHQAAAQSKVAIESIIREIGQECGAADPCALAEELCMLMEGAYVTRLVTGNPATIEIARRAAARIIDGHVPMREEQANKPEAETVSKA